MWLNIVQIFVVLNKSTSNLSICAKIQFNRDCISENDRLPSSLASASSMGIPPDPSFGLFFFNVFCRFLLILHFCVSQHQKLIRSLQVPRFLLKHNWKYGHNDVRAGVWLSFAWPKPLRLETMNTTYDTASAALPSLNCKEEVNVLIITAASSWSLGTRKRKAANIFRQFLGKNCLSLWEISAGSYYLSRARTKGADSKKRKYAFAE